MTIVKKRNRNEQPAVDGEFAEFEELKASILEAIPYAVIGLQDRRIIFVNNGVKTVFGWTSDELIGKSTRLFYRSEQDYIRIAGVIYSILEKHPVVSIEFPCVRKDGSEIECMVRGARIGKKLKQRQIVITYENITDRKCAERELEHSQHQLRKLSAHLQSIHEVERARIARELHDELGQILTALNTEIVMLKNRIPADLKALSDGAERMVALVDLTMESAKHIYMGLRPDMLDHLGLTAAITWEAGEFSKRTGIPCTVTFRPEEITLDPDLTTAIFRIFQEALTNVQRHAEATRVTARLRMSGGDLEFVVRDNGRGILEKQMRKPNSFGLLGIQERVYHWGGQVDISGKNGRGTTVSIKIPVPGAGESK